MATYIQSIYILGILRRVHSFRKRVRMAEIVFGEKCILNVLSFLAEYEEYSPDGFSVHCNCCCSEFKTCPILDRRVFARVTPST